MNGCPARGAAPPILSCRVSLLLNGFVDSCTEQSGSATGNPAVSESAADYRTSLRLAACSQIRQATCPKGNKRPVRLLRILPSDLSVTFARVRQVKVRPHMFRVSEGQGTERLCLLTNDVDAPLFSQEASRKGRQGRKGKDPGFLDRMEDFLIHVYYKYCAPMELSLAAISPKRRTRITKGHKPFGATPN